MRIFAPAFAKLLSTPTEKVRKRILAAMPAGPFTSKTTRPDRLRDLDAAIILCAEQVLSADEITVHDMAASDGITSLELFDRLSERRSVRLRSSDYYDGIGVVRRGPFLVFYDKEQAVIQVALGALALRGTRANRFLARLLSPDLTKLRQVSLLHPDVVARAKADSRFTAATDTFFSPAPARYDVVRVMNALGERNFPRPHIERAIRAIATTVADGGLLVLGRSADELDGRAEATIFQRTEGGFVPLVDLGGGYELRDFVLTL